MEIKVVPTDNFIKELKRLSKKHRNILSDIAELSKELKSNPRMGTDLGQNVYKVRLAISGTNKGKSGGARVITYLKIIAETVYLAEIYLKNEHDTADVDRVIHRLQKEGLI